MQPTSGPLGEYIRDYRKRERWTLRGFGKRAGISIGKLHGIEHGREANIRIKTVIALARACETTVARIATLAAATLTMEGDES